VDLFGAIFLNRAGNLRSGWWLGIFMLSLAALLFPALLVARHYNRDITLLDQSVMILAATWLCQMLRRKALREVIGRLNRAWAANLALGCAYGALLMLAPALFLFAGGWCGWAFSHASLESLAGGVLLMAGVAFAEELLFRGFLFQRLIDGVGVWPAQILIGGLFVLTHLNNPGMVGVTKLWASANIFLASVLFGLAYLRTRSLAMPMGIHFMANTTQGVVLGFGVSGNGETGLLIPHFGGAPAWLTGAAFGLEASTPGLLCVVAGALLFYRSSQRSDTSTTRPKEFGSETN